MSPVVRTARATHQRWPWRHAVPDGRPLRILDEIQHTQIITWLIGGDGDFHHIAILGTHSLVSLATADGSRITANVTSNWEPGETAGVTWSKEHARLLRP